MYGSFVEMLMADWYEMVMTSLIGPYDSASSDGRWLLYTLPRYYSWHIDISIIILITLSNLSICALIALIFQIYYYTIQTEEDKIILTMDNAFLSIL